MFATTLAHIAETMRVMQERGDAPKKTAREEPQDEQERPGETLLPERMSRSSQSQMTELLQALGLGTDDLDLRPSLFACVTAAGYDTVSPFRKMLGTPLNLNLASMMDENAVTASIRSNEHAELQTSMRDDAGTFEESKGGTLQRVAGKRPKLTMPAYKKEIKTYQDMLLALYNLAYHYDRVGKPEWTRLIGQHIVSMRRLWDRGGLVGSHKHIIELDEILRERRCRQGELTSWNLDDLTTPGSPEGTIVARAMQDAHWAQAAPGHSNSTRPGKDQPAANKEAKEAAAKAAAKKPCSSWAKNGECNRKSCPNFHDPKTKAATAAPATAAQTAERKLISARANNRYPLSHRDDCEAAGICAFFAWNGICNGKLGTPSCVYKGTTYKHTCLTCAFAKGPHELINGDCP
jgi:hypothetical protein